MTIEELMKTLNCSEDEAKSIIETDKAIDRGEDPFPLTPEQKAVEKKMRQGHKAPTAYKFQKRERKPNEAKRDIIELFADALHDFLLDNDDAIEIDVVNPERQIDFAFDGVRYRIVLSAPRK